MSAVKRFTDLFDRVRSPLGKLSGTASGPRDDDLIAAVIQRVEVEGEDETVVPPAGDTETRYRRLMRRLEWQLKSSGITVEELVRTNPKEVSSILLFKSYEGSKSKRKLVVTFRERLIEIGFKSIQPGVWILPPNRTPPGVDSQESLKMWFRQQMVKPVPRTLDYVFPFIASVDLKKVVSERRGIRKMPTARTLFGVLSVEEVATPSHVYSTMKSRGLGVRDIILAGDVAFLASAFADGEDLDGIRVNELEIGGKLRHATGASAINLEDIANLGPETIAKALTGYVAHPKDFAQRLIVEAQYWMRLLGGSVPA
ncbi:MAG: hypothetical protein JRM73_03455 [Nitrososphaerota archaeon]|nr:hypothetical protein [Nitrososphaerota archaeon]